MVRLASATLAALVALMAAGSSPSDRDGLVVLGFGNSHTQGGDWWVDPIPDAWRFVDRGRNGNTCSEVADRAEREERSADVAVVFCGTNDVVAARWSPAESLAEADRALAAADHLAAGLVLVAPPPLYAADGLARVDPRSARLATLRDGFRELADEHGAELADLFEAFAGIRDAEALFVDGVHVNAQGRRVMAGVIARAIREAAGGGDGAPPIAAGPESS